MTKMKTKKKEIKKMNPVGASNQQARRLLFRLFAAVAAAAAVVVVSACFFADFLAFLISTLFPS